MLTANSPAPYPTIEPYYGVEVTGSKTDRTNTAGETMYSVTVTNVGDRCIVNKSSISGHPTNSVSHTNSFGWGYYTGSIFDNWAIVPGQSVSFTTPILGNEIEDFSKYSWSTNTYNLECPNVTIENMSISQEPGFRTYKLNGKISNLEDYYYAAIIEVTYKNKDYAFEVSINKSSSRRITVKEELDLSKLTINKATVYRSSYNTYKSTSDAMIAIAIGVMVSIVLFVGAAIAIPIIIVTTRKRHKNKNISK